MNEEQHPSHLPQDPLSINELVFGGLDFIRQNPRVFRKYYFLPLMLSIAALFLAQIPIFGLAASTLFNSMAVAMISVSVVRFYFTRDPDKVAEGANIAFARMFFVTFIMATLGHMTQSFQAFPPAAQGLVFMWLGALIWLNLKICLAYPALAMNDPRSVVDTLKASFGWTDGYLLKIIGCLMVCYSPFLLFSIMLMQIPGAAPDIENFWNSIPQVIFADAVIVFCTLWSYVALAKLYEGVVVKRDSAK